MLINECVSAMIAYYQGDESTVDIHILYIKREKSGGFMHCKGKNERKEHGNEMPTAANMSLSINYGDVIASVKADKEMYVAKITGKVGEVKGWPFHQFIIRFIKSIEKASNLNEPI